MSAGEGGASADETGSARRALDRAVAAAIAAAQWLVLPVSLLLFAQWPLRDLLGRYSVEANDLAQWLFALYVAVAVTAATRAGTHLAAASLAARYPALWRARLAKAGFLLALIPWSLFILYAGGSMIGRSILGLEAFPETFDPGYFLIKASLALLALLVLAQALLDLLRPAGPR